MFEATVGEALLATARRHAERPALTAEGQRLSYRQLFERALGIAAGLDALELEPGAPVALLCRRTPTAYGGLLGILLAGHPYVPLNVRFPTERNREILRGSGARALIVDSASAANLANVLADLHPVTVLAPEPDTPSDFASAGFIGAAKLAPTPLESEWAPTSVRRADPAYLLFTSGTTGVPKGVPISHANLAAYLEAISALFQVTPDDRVLQASDLTFDLSVNDMMLAWLAGAMLYSLPEGATILAPRFIAEQAITVCQLVPSAGAAAAQRGLLAPGRLPSLRISLFAGEALPVSVAKAWRAAAPNTRLINGYGPTEGTIYTSAFEFGDDCPQDYPVVPIGFPLGRQRMEIRDADGSPLAAGETGEIWLSGPQMTAGYWRAPDLDAVKFVTLGGSRWYKTGDLGRLTASCGLIFAGRTDRQVKIRGYRVELQEVEGALRKACDRVEVAVIAWPMADGGVAGGCVGFVADLELDAAAALSRCRCLLPPYMTPERLVLIDAIPLNQNGKTDYMGLASHPALARRPARRRNGDDGTGK